MQSLAKIVQQTFWQVLGKIVTSLSTFIILGLVTRNYGQEGTGVFTLALTYLAIFYLFGDFGFNAHVLKKVQSSEFIVRSEWRKLLGTRLLWSGILVILAVGLLPFWPFSTSEFTKAVLLGSLAIMASAVFVTANLIFQGELRYDLSAISSTAGTLVGLVVTIWLVTVRQPISQLILGHLIGWIVIALISLILSSRRLILRPVAIFYGLGGLLRRFTPRNDVEGIIFDLSYTISLFRQSWPIAATLSLNVLYFRADSFMVAYFKSMADAGVYNVAYSVFQSALVLPTFVMNAYYPMMLKSFRGIKLILLGLLGLSLAGTVITLFFAPLVIKIITGGGFVGSTQSLRILSLGFPAYFLSSLLMWFLIARGKYKVMFLLYMSGLIFNLSLNLVYIPRYSYFAASWITVISEYFILIAQIVVLSFWGRAERGFQNRILDKPE